LFELFILDFDDKRDGAVTTTETPSTITFDSKDDDKSDDVELVSDDAENERMERLALSSDSFDTDFDECDDDVEVDGDRAFLFRLSFNDLDDEEDDDDDAVVADTDEDDNELVFNLFAETDDDDDDDEDDLADKRFTNFSFFCLFIFSAFGFDCVVVVVVFAMGRLSFIESI
jgi:hypothetical protein